MSYFCSCIHVCYVLLYSTYLLVYFEILFACSHVTCIWQADYKWMRCCWWVWPAARRRVVGPRLLLLLLLGVEGLVDAAERRCQPAESRRRRRRHIAHRQRTCRCPPPPLVRVAGMTTVKVVNGHPVVVRRESADRHCYPTRWRQRVHNMGGHSLWTLPSCTGAPGHRTFWMHYISLSWANNIEQRSNIAVDFSTGIPQEKYWGRDLNFHELTPVIRHHAPVSSPV